MKTTGRCPICRKRFTRIHTEYKPPTYCSRACANKAPGRMTEEIKKRIAMHGPDHPRYKGGWVSHNKSGKDYFMLWVPPEERDDHPTCTTHGYIHRSHYVWNNAHPDDKVILGQIIHHKNKNSLDDSIENLEKFTNQLDHMRADDMSSVSKKRRRDRFGKFV